MIKYNDLEQFLGVDRPLIWASTIDKSYQFMLHHGQELDADYNF